MTTLIYVVEDDPSISKLYECTFENSGFSTKCFENAENMFQSLKNEIPSVIIMDLMLPKMDGLTAIKLLKGEPKYSGIPVIIISANGEETTKVRGLNIGAEDYIEKPFGILELTARVKKVIGRKTSPAKQDILSYKDIEINSKKHTVLAGGVKAELTPKEFDLLYLLISRHGEVLQRDEIFDIIWGENYFTETRTLDIHIKSLRKKLMQICGNEYINTVRGIGYTIE